MHKLRFEDALEREIEKRPKNGAVEQVNEKEYAESASTIVVFYRPPLVFAVLSSNMSLKTTG